MKTIVLSIIIIGHEDDDDNDDDDDVCDSMYRSRIAVHDSEGHDSEELTNLLHRYLRFDDEMLQVAVQWRDCFQLIEQYNDEQVMSLFYYLISA